MLRDSVVHEARKVYNPKKKPENPMYISRKLNIDRRDFLFYFHFRKKP
jgi:hypothetical protein